jgi:uncharacterized protein YutE (UPF0331/DUF86 family)
MVSKEIINSKLANILDYIKELEPILTLEALYLLDKKNYRDLRTLERDFQMIVDTMIEINSHFISKLKLEVPEDYANTFFVLGRSSILPLEFAIKLSKAVGLRNKIVHKYDIIDMKKFIDDLKAGSHQFSDYISYIRKYLDGTN